MKGYEIIRELTEVPMAEVIVILNNKEYKIKDICWMGYNNGGNMKIELEEDNN